MKKFFYRKVNFIARILEDDDAKFRFEVFYRNDLLVTNGKAYDDISACSKDLAVYLVKLADVEYGESVLVADTFVRPTFDISKENTNN